MGAFALVVTGVQSGDGKIVAITDGSDYTNNDQGYLPSDFVRNFIITDYLGNLLTTISLDSTQLTATYNVPNNTNPWLQIQETAVGPANYTDTVKLPADRNYQLAFIDVIKGNCGCSCRGDNTLCEVDAFYAGAAYAIPIGDPVSYQTNIDAAYKLVTSI